ncbi:endogenous retrovirus group 3 member 1 Env polyprotein-like [Pantherophis guttatus]|uniref:Endogenous retrovirus group 3 member 1 Env polyprotein-like n=1 Tax=Pantherophis guttatus TaxID=94885 RepID=A0ABM3ZM38_PANGU|nr:endogenous retrovirus group 3 member 1 Env polyprotein-like [Pantherophis guttatus]
MDPAQRIRETACIRRGLLPSIWVVIVLLLASIVINSLYLYRVLLGTGGKGSLDLEGPLSPLDQGKRFPTDDDIWTWLGGNMSPTLDPVLFYDPVGIEPEFSPSQEPRSLATVVTPSLCTDCFLSLSIGRRFAFTLLAAPNCSSGYLPPCKYKNYSFLRCNDDPLQKCHLIRPFGSDHHGTSRKHRTTREVQIDHALGQSPCSCETNRKVYGKPASCTQFDLTTCKAGQVLYNRCNGTGGIYCYLQEGDLTECSPCVRQSSFLYTPLLTSMCSEGRTCTRDSVQYKVCVLNDAPYCYRIGPFPPRQPAPKLKQPPKAPIPSSCAECIVTTRSDQVISNTLIYHTAKPDDCPTELSTCTLNNTIYRRCRDKRAVVQCYDPSQITKWTEHGVYLYHMGGSGLELVASNSTPYRQQSLTLTFDACNLINRGGYYQTRCGGLDWEREYMFNSKYMCLKTRSKPDCHIADTYNWCPYKSCVSKTDSTQAISLRNGVAASNCPLGKCNPVVLTFHHSLWSMNRDGAFADYGFQIDGRGRDPGAKIRIKFTKRARSRGDTKHLFWSFYEEIAKLNIPDFPAQVHNTFVRLAEDIAHTLNVSNCFVCGGTNMGDKWPWEAQELNYSTVLDMEHRNNLTATPGKDGTWALTSNLVGSVCYTRNRSNGCFYVGSLRCRSAWNNRTWWSGTNRTYTTDDTALERVQLLQGYILDPMNKAVPWLAPDGMYWLCGAFAYAELPAGWCGSCVLGIIRPGFFLLPLRNRQILGVPVYDEIGNLIRSRRHVDTSAIEKVKVGGSHTFQEEEWPAERIIQYYGPATWAEDGMWGYRTPIYLLNRLIRLQAVVEIITNETVKGLTKLAKESVKSRTYIMQNRLALDYLLAKEGGVCGKFNLSNCCIEIDDSGHVIKEITDKMVKIAHVPVQTWRGLNLADAFSGWFPKLPGLQAIVALIGLIAAGCVILPCVLPIFIRTITSTLSLLVDKKATAQAMAWWEYQKLVDIEGRSVTEGNLEYETLQ